MPDTTPSPFGNETVDSLAARIKAKYPAYGQLDNAQLVRQTIQKFPVYQTSLSTEALQGLSAPKEASFWDVAKGAIPGALQFGGSVLGAAVAPSGDTQHQAIEQANNPTGLDPLAGMANAALRVGRRVIAPQEQEQLAKAKQLYSRGQYPEAAGYAASMALPIAGPIATQSAEYLGQRQYGAGLAMAGMVLAPELAHGLRGTETADVARPADSTQAAGPATAPLTPPRPAAPSLETPSPQKPVAAIETPVQAASTPSQVPAALPDVTRMSSGDLARAMFDGHEGAKEEMLRRQAASRPAQTNTPQDQLVNSLGLKSTGTQAGLVNFEHPSHPGLSAAVPIEQGMDANAIRSAMANRLEAFSGDPKYASDTLTQSIQGIRNRLPSPQDAPGTQPEAPGQAIGTANDRPQYVYKPSEKAANMSGETKDLGPEFNAAQLQHEIERNKAILRNPAATPEDLQVATQRIEDTRKFVQEQVSGGTPASNPPNYVYRSRDMGEEGVPSASHSQATDNLEQAQGYLTTREGVTKNPQQLIKIDLNKLHPSEYVSMPHPDGMNWYKFSRDLGEHEVEPVYSAGPDEIAEKSTPAPTARPDATAPAIQNAPKPPATPEPVEFDADDFNKRISSIEKWKGQLDSKQVVGIQAAKYSNLLDRMRGALKDQLNQFVQGSTHSDREVHLDVTAEAERLRSQATEVRDVLKQNSLAKAMRQEMSVRPNRPWQAEFKLGSVDEGTGMFHEISEPLPGALRDQFHTLLGDKATSVPGQLDESEWSTVRASAKAQLDDAKAALNTRMEEIAGRTGDLDSPKAALLDKALREEKLINGRDIKSEVQTLQAILGQGRERLRYVSKGEPVTDSQGVVRAPGSVKELSLKWAQDVLGKKNLNRIPDEATLLKHADNLEKRATLLDTVAKRVQERRKWAADQTQAGGIGAATLGMSSGGMAAGAAIGHAIAGTPGALVGGAIGFVAGAALPALYHIPAVADVINSLGREVRELGFDTAGGVKDVGKSLINFLAPKVGVDTKSLNAIYQMKGDIAASMKAAGNVLDVYRKNLDKLGTAGQIDFIDRYKQGLQQATPELQALANTIKQLDKENYDKISLFKPGLNFLDNHFRMLYKTLPGQAGAAGFEGWLGKRPLAGSKGFLQQHVYDTLSDAMANGGVPMTTNPVDLFLMGHADVQRFIHANMLWEWAKNEGVATFQKNGSKPAPGYVPLDDRISKVYFPAASGEGNINPGAYRVQEGFGRLMNNYLSPDYIRQNVLGKKIIDFKNATNSWELIGGFHAVTINGAALVQNLNLAAQRMYNLGIRGSSASEFAAGMKDLLNAPLELARGNAPAYLEGKRLEDFGAAIDRYKRGDAGALQHFTNSDSGQKFLQKYPGAEGLLGDAFTGGLNFKLSDDIRSNVTKNMLQSITDKKYIAALGRVPGAAIYEMNRPLFDNYIPRLKLGMFLRDMSTQLKDRAPDILNGSLTREELARKVVNRTENVFGEMNYDNMFWNKTFKTSMQLFYRSVTWRMGTTLAEGTGIFGQGKELVNAVKQGNLPRLDPSFGFVGGSLLTLGVTAAVMQKIMAGKNPGSMADLTHPQTGDKNDIGRPVRLNIPGYGSEFLKLSTDPLKYMVSGRSGFLDKLMESWQNKDFYGKQIANPNDPKLEQFAAKALHAMAPQMIMSSNIDRMKASGATKGEAALGLAGFSTTSKSVDMSPAELKAQEIALRSMPDVGRTADQVAHRQAITKMITDIQNNRQDIARESFKAGMKDGSLKIDDLQKVLDRIQTPLLEGKLKGAHLPDLLSVYDVASPDEKRRLAPLVQNKIGELMDMPPALRDQMKPRVQAAMAGK